ncbi:MAG: cadherin-like beta sandwich domain-containing protein, partial [Gammaproteobacteria bacterium]|nr:cadherin-like beta sandwich domain-containing protein [Gammaproteobacteria bacterium]
MPAKIQTLFRSRAALFAAAVFCLAALFQSPQALAQPTSITLTQNTNFWSIVAAWQAPESGTATEYKLRWAKGEGSTNWVNAGGADGVSAGTALTYTIEDSTSGGVRREFDAGRIDVQVAAVVGGVTTWSPSTGLIIGNGRLPSLTLHLSNGQTLTYSLLNTGIVDTPGVSADVVGVSATGVTLGGGDFGMKISGGDLETAASGATTAEVALSVGKNFFNVGSVAADSGRIYSSFTEVIINRNAPVTATAVPGAPAVSLSGLGSALRASWELTDPLSDAYRVTWRTADPDGAGAQTAGAWQDESGDDADCAAAPAADPGASLDCGRHVAALMADITGLDDALTYDVRVRGLNTFGAGTWSTTQSATPSSVQTPGVPQLSALGSRERGLETQILAGSGAAASYRVRWRLADADGSGPGTAPGAWQDANGADAECNDNDADNDHMCGEEVALSSGAATLYLITGLELALYDVSAAAVNSAGASAWSAVQQGTPIVSADATLSNLAVSAGQLSPAFASVWRTYEVLLDRAESGIAITATLNQQNAAFTLQEGSGTPAAGASGVASSSFPIDAGASRVFRIAVTADDGNARRTYVITVRRLNVPDAPANFSAAAGVRSIAADWNAPANDGFAEVTAYRVRWRVSDDGSGTPGAWQDASGDDAECNDNDADNDAMCGVEVAASSTAYAISGLDAVSYDVAAAAVNSAGIGAWSDAQATPRKSSNANLSALHPSVGGLTPVFTAATLTYELFLLNAQATSITVTATLADTSARFTLQEDAETPVAGTSGAASSAINLVAGVGKLVRIAVTAEDGSTQKIYAIEVKRQGPPAAPLNPSASAAGRTITVRWEEPHDGFVNLGGYLVRWRRSDAGSGSPGPWQDANGEDAECNDNNAGNDALCGVEVAASSTAYTISGLDKASYDVAVAALNFHGPSAWSEAQAAPSGLDDATLSALAMSSGNLSPAFDAATTEYTAVVPNQDAEVGITATLNDEHASFTLQVDSGTPAAGASGVASALTSIAVGASVTFKIAVTSDDGTAEKTYTVVATRPILPNAPANLKVTPGRAAFSLDWDEPAAVAGAPITGYRVRFTTVTPPTWNGNNGADGITTGSADATWNLTRNGTLWFAVASVSEAGQSEWSAAQGPVSTSSTNPDPPRNLSAVSANELQVRWQAPTDPDVQSYRVRWKADGVNTYTPELRVAATMTSIANLPSGKYDVQVAALEAGVDDAITSATLSSVWASATFDAAATDNADLRELSVVNAADQTALAPGFSFDRETLSYEITVDNATASVALRPTTANSGANIRVTAGTAAPAALAGGAEVSVNLQKGVPFTVRFAVTSADGSATKTYSITLIRTPDALNISGPAEIFYYTGAPVTTVLPAASGGFPPYSYFVYRLGQTRNDPLPDGFSFDADARALTGDFDPENVGVGGLTWALQYQVVDSARTPQGDLHTLNTAIARPVVFASAVPAALTFEYNTARNLGLPTANGGFTPLSYALSGDTLPPGLAFTKSSRTLGGTPTQGGLFRITYSAQDRIAGDSGTARADIDLTVTAGPASAL